MVELYFGLKIIGKIIAFAFILFWIGLMIWGNRRK